MEPNFRNWLQKKLTASRYEHSCEVEKRAGILAQIHGENVEKARLAGLLHDCCHSLAKDEQLKVIESHGILLDILTKAQPQLWHAVAGSILVEDELGIHDPEILAAIRYHTTGREKMSKLEQVIYLADYTSLDRHYPGVLKNRKLSEKSLEKCMLKSLKQTLGKLVRARVPIVSDACAAYNYFWELEQASKTRAE